jgi:Uncharacterized protein conserved in bacteria (DUF2188)
MTKKLSRKTKRPGIAHPGMMGDGTEEQNLNERGNPTARIKKDEVEAVFQKRPSNKKGDIAKITYEVVEHDGGWAYRVNGVFSEAFPTHALAHEAAERAAREQVVAGETTDISYEDSDGRWHQEVSEGDDRPETSVKD